MSSYQGSGVDIDAAERAKERIAQRVAATHGPAVLGGIGHFGGFFRAPRSSGDVVLVATADSVGTKVLVAVTAGSHRSIGIDLVNHCVNDILACGARPLFFLDYYATPELDAQALSEIIDGMSDACLASGCALIGGETAQLPGIYQARTYDLAGFLVGSVQESRIVDGARVRAGDVVIGLPSSGLHTNGYSLARAAFGLNANPEAMRRLQDRPNWAGGRTLTETLLEPHRSYIGDIDRLAALVDLRAMAHITGGGLAGNLARVIPKGLEAIIDPGSWTVPPVFEAIAKAGNVERAEMYRVFNMGIGFVLVVDAKEAYQVCDAVEGALVIGMIQPGERTRAQVIGFDAVGGS